MLSSSSSPSRSSEDPLIDLRPTSSSSSLSSSWPSRAPIVTIMGHVDHGKTTLLDTLRGTSIATTEAGGITQHLGAFEVVLSNQSKITFLDTPGHAAFENLRERGAQVTDIVVLVVAVDDGVMPQTIEAIKHAQAAQVPIIVALNKCDRKGAEDVEKTKLALLRHGVQVEDLGGDVMSIPISALKGTGIDHLEEAIVTLSELQELRGDVEGAIEAVILESQVRKGVGPVATVLLRHGTLRQGTILVTSDTWCRVRRMVNAFGQTVLSVGPSTPVEVHGWKALPISGQPVYSTSNEAKAKKYVLQQATTPTPPSPSPLSSNILHGALKELNQSASTKKCITIGVKGDVSGSVEALVHFVHSFSHPELQLQLLFSGVGPFSESELTLAQSSQAILVGLNLKLDKTSILWIQKNKLMYIGSNVIYTLFNDLKLHLASYLDPLYSIEKIGSAQILQFFPYQTEHEVVTVLGCKVLDGKIMKNKNVQILRKEELVWEGPLKTIRHFKKEVHEISKGNECGIVIDGFDQCQINDTLHCIQKVSIPRTID
ncbi:hypothetical protein HMI54_004802 [Coelomomyces lativittatus]|nr:hypothetical protein HMI54_004802 [Coelomomyces lativittatus]KAJ1507797.1 hypothetical protein HMI55_000633 [Coelomomyces lativittatus]KAJ1508098.1 hypothetical protein HMI56_007463 [Coelomomyces lativittatus]